MSTTAIERHMPLLGRRVTDKITGVTGVVTSVTFDLYGCIQALIQPPTSEDGKTQDPRWFDVARLAVGKEKPVMSRPDFSRIVPADEEWDKGPAEKPLP